MKSIYTSCATAIIVFVVGSGWASPPQPTLSFTLRKIHQQKAGQYEITAVYPVFAGTTPVVRLANTRLRVSAEEQVQSFLELAQESQRSRDGDSVPGEYSLEVQPHISIARPDLISVYFEHYEYTGGAHPNSDLPALSFGMVQGKAQRLLLPTLFRRDVDSYGAITRIALPYLKVHKASSVTSGAISRLDAKTIHNWVVTPSGIILLFAPYEVASYAEGSFRVECSFAKMREALDTRGPLRTVLGR